MDKKITIVTMIVTIIITMVLLVGVVFLFRGVITQAESNIQEELPNEPDIQEPIYYGTWVIDNSEMTGIIKIDADGFGAVEAINENGEYVLIRDYDRPGFELTNIVNGDEIILVEGILSYNTKTDTLIYGGMELTRIEEEKVIPHTHEMTEWKIVLNPSCTEEGQEKRTCECGETETREIAAIGHDYVEIIVMPTCTKDGYTTHRCLRCEDLYTDNEVEALGHTFGEWEVITPATSTEAGLEQRVCSTCGETETREIPVIVPIYYGTWLLDNSDVTGIIIIDSSGSFGFAEAVSDNNGNYILSSEYTYTGLELTEIVNGDEIILIEGMLSYNTKTDTIIYGGMELTRIEEEKILITEDTHIHTWSEWQVSTAPTCTEEGLEERTCQCSDDVAYTETRKIPALGHTFSEWVVITPATCTEKGIEEHRCTCGYSNGETREIAIVEHNYTDTVLQAATCSAEGLKERTCSVCGYVCQETIPIDSTKHTYGEKVLIHEATCYSPVDRYEFTCVDCGFVGTGGVARSVPHTPTEDIDYANNTLLCSECNNIFPIVRDTSSDFTYAGYNSSNVQTSVFLARYCSITGARGIDTSNPYYYISARYKNKPVKLNDANVFGGYPVEYIYVEDGVEINNLQVFAGCSSLKYISLPASARGLNLDFSGCPDTLQILYRD